MSASTRELTGNHRIKVWKALLISLRDTNPPTNPELLAALEDRFRGFSSSPVPAACDQDFVVKSKS